MTTPHTSGDSVAAPTILKPCPFCADGGKPYGPVTADYTYARGDQYVYCETCEAQCGYAPSGDAAIARWNERSTGDSAISKQRLRSASAAPVEGVFDLASLQVAADNWADEVVALYELGTTHRGKLIAGFKAGARWAKAPAATAPPSEQAAPVEAPTGEKVDDLGYALVSAVNLLRERAKKNDEGGYDQSASQDRASAKLLIAHLDALRTDPAPGLPAQAAKPPTCGVTITEDAKDAKRFRWCQDNPHAAQAMFWNHSSRRDRAKAIDAAMSRKGERGRGEAPLSRGDPA